MDIKPYDSYDESQVTRLWRDCGLLVPWNDPSRDIQRKLEVQPELFLVGWLDGKIIATVMAGYDGHRGWINYLAVHPDHRHAGVGRSLMAAAEVRLRKIGCPKINLQVRSTNTGAVEFYRKIGFNVDDVVSLGKRLVPDK
jgi:ribosomal protein S18 acetylase RimI-like enzyme